MHKQKTIIEVLARLSSELMQRRENAQFFNIIQSKKEKHDLLKLDDKLWRDWDNLERCLCRPVLLVSHYFWDPQTLDQKIELEQWIANLMHLSSNLVEQHWAMFNLPSNLSEFEIWRDMDDEYWYIIFQFIKSWEGLTNSNLESVKWDANSYEIKIIMRWLGKFASGKKLDIREVNNDFWTISLQDDQTFCLPESSDTLLLSTQLLAQQRSNLFSLIELNSYSVTLELKMPRANAPLSRPPVSLVSASIVEQVVNRLLEQISVNYIEISQQIENRLLTEINRLEPYALKNNIEGISLNDLKAVRTDLVSMRESFTEMIS